MVHKTPVIVGKKIIIVVTPFLTWGMAIVPPSVNFLGQLTHLLWTLHAPGT